MAETSISGIEFKIVGSTSKAKTAVDKLTSSLKGLKTALSSAHTAKLEKELEGIDKNAKKSTTTLGKLFKSIGRIGFYRAIRSALKFITEGFREGLQNAYQFSKIVGYDLAATMDNLATKSLTMKNQLGSAFGGLLMAIEPILLQIIALVTRAANALAQFFAAIGGKETYLKAIDTVTQYGEAVSGAGQAAKEAMRYLAPFDELNVLPAQNEPGGGGGGASTPDYSQMFEESPVMQKLAEFGASLKLAFNDMFIDWTDLNPEQISEKIIGAILGLTGFLAGITITGSLTGGLIVGIAGVATALVFNSVVFDHDGVLDKREIQSMLRLALIGITGGLIGFAIGGPGGALIGASIGLGLDAALEAINFFTDGKIEGAIDGLVRGISAGLGGVIGFMIGGPAGAVLGATIGLGISFGLENFVFGDTTGWSTGDWIRNIVATLAPVAGAAIGLVVGGPAGALVGATIGLGIQFALNADTTEGAENSGKTLGEKILEGIGKPFKAIGTWIKEHIVDPIKEKLKDFSISNLLFGSDGNSSDGTSGDTKIDIEASLIKVGDWSQDVVDVVKEKGGEVKKTVNTIVQKAQGWVKEAGDALLSPNAVTKTVSTAVDKAKSWIKEAADVVLSPNAVTKTVTTALNTAASWAKEAYTAITQPEKKTTTVTASVLKGTWVKDAWEATKLKASSIKKKVTSTVTKGKTFVQDAFTAAKMKASSIIRAVASAVSKGSWDGEAYKVSTLTTGKVTRDVTANAKKGSINQNAYNVLTARGGYVDMYANITSLTNGLGYDPSLSATASFTSWADNIPADQKYIQMSASIIGVAGQSGWDANGAVYMNGVKRPVTMMASGGILRNTPQLFVARESGPELVGTLKGHTAVMNNDQIVASVSAGVARAIAGIQFHLAGFHPANVQTNDSYDYDAIYQAVVDGIRDSGVGDEEITLDGDVLYRKMVQRNQMNTRMTGRNVMATA